MCIKAEANIVRLYSKRYNGSFYRTLGASLEHALPHELTIIRNAFPEWWQRCLDNTKLLEARGIPLEQ